MVDRLFDSNRSSRERTGDRRYGRLAILSLVAFFIIGIVIMAFVDLDKGRQEALAGENN